MKTTLPIVLSPVNLFGWAFNRVAIPPVAIVQANHAKVKLDHGQYVEIELLVCDGVVHTA